MPTEPVTSTNFPTKPLRPAEVAEIVGVSRRSVYRWVKAGVLSPTVIRGRIYFNPGSLKQLLGDGR